MIRSIKAMTKHLLLFLVVVALTSALLAMACTESLTTTGELTIVNDEMTTENAYSVVKGSGVSASDWNVVTVDVKFYDDADNLIGEGSDFGALDSGEAWDFEAQCLEAGIATRYELVVTDGELTDVTSEMELDTEWAYSEVRGLAKNTGDSDLDWVTVQVKFHDSDGNLIYQGSDLTQDLDPGETWSFEVTCFEGVAESYSIVWED